MIGNLGESGKVVLAYARRIATNLDHGEITPAHLVLAVGDLEDLAIRRATEVAGLLSFWGEAIVRIDATSGQFVRNLVAHVGGAFSSLRRVGRGCTHPEHARACARSGSDAPDGALAAGRRAGRTPTQGLHRGGSGDGQGDGVVE